MKLQLLVAVNAELETLSSVGRHSPTLALLPFLMHHLRSDHRILPKLPSYCFYKS